MVNVFVVAHPNFKRRFDYITQHVRDRLGDKFETVGVVGKDADLSTDSANSELSYGQLGCALSHLSAYRLMVERGLPWAFIVEDDVILPGNIGEMVAYLGNNIQDGEIIQLNNWTGSKMYFCKPGATETPYGRLYYPLNAISLGSTPAYLISLSAARGILEANYPVKATADNFTFFYANGAFRTCRVLYPFPVKLKAFETTIWNVDSLKGYDIKRLAVRILKIILGPARYMKRVFLQRMKSKDVVICDSASEMQPS